MKILITGGTGLVGSNLVEQLREGNAVVSLSRSEGFDLRNTELVANFIGEWEPEIVYHLAANAAESRGQASPLDMTENNLNILLNTLVPAINAKVKRFIFTSSVAVYGDIEVPYSEDDIPKPKDVYGVNKLAGEQIIKILAKVHNFEYTIFRPHNIYGPHQDMSNPYKNVVALFMRQLIEDKPITIYGEGKMRRAFSYVDDVIDIMIGAMDERGKNQTINIGSSLDIDLLTLIHKIEAIANKKAKIIFKPARPQEIYSFLASHRKQNALFDYKETPLDEGLQKTWDFVTLPKIKNQYDEIHTN